MIAVIGYITGVIIGIVGAACIAALLWIAHEIITVKKGTVGTSIKVYKWWIWTDRTGKAAEIVISRQNQ